ncbi:MAG TPA: FAD-dependent oxidoreductase [Bryobacteraceae bacterium]|nr:FAD-dependent oxidoreductase [Bryobacteraceae bacterium]
MTLTIDGRRVSVEPGTTLMAAAQWLGIRIPSMCHVPGIEPAASCFVCAVQIEGRRTLSPACAVPVAEGMSVTTNSDDVRAARKMALELLLSDHAGECVAPCAARCPAGLDIPGFVYGIATGDNRRAMEAIAERLALPGSLGRICPRLCEEGCRRCDLDQGLAIGALHRYAADLDIAAVTPYTPPCAPTTGKSVAIVGAGPAGLAAAWYLLQKGHGCTLFDAHPQPGGMLRYGIPAYRLPKDALDAEIDAIRKLGARFQMGVRWGTEFTLGELRKQYDAVFLAIGAQRAQGLRCEGEENALAGIAFLELAANSNAPSLGRDVAVVGGGNTAMDCARSAVRLGAQNVRILYRRGRQEMPCAMDEVEAAEAEGVHIDYLVAPMRLDRNGRGLLLTCQRMTLGEPDASGRRRPVAVAGSDFVIECSTVIAAIGQAVERTLAGREGLRVTGWGIAADERTLATNLPGVFAGGDAVLGADLAVRAVAAGRISATSIHQYLSGESVAGESVLTGIAMRPIDDAERAAIFRAIEKSARAPMPRLPMEQRRATFDEVERGLTPDDAARESRRCLSCGCRKQDCCLVRTLANEYEVDVYRFAGARRRFSQDLSHPEIVYEPGKCISCDACVRIAAAAGETLGLAMIGRGFDVTVAVPFGKPLSEGLRSAAQRCAEACPTGALALRTARSCDACSLSSCR